MSTGGQQDDPYATHHPDGSPRDPVERAKRPARYHSLYRDLLLAAELVDDLAAMSEYLSEQLAEANKLLAAHSIGDDHGPFTGAECRAQVMRYHANSVDRPRWMKR